jgi:hypothetical protein
MAMNGRSAPDRPNSQRVDMTAIAMDRMSVLHEMRRCEP